MRLVIRFLPEARSEFDAAADWYDQQRPGLGRDFVCEVRDVLRRIAANPRLHPVVHQDVRKAVVKRFPYIVLYREEQQGILLISVFHTSRDPAIWQARLP